MKTYPVYIHYISDVQKFVRFMNTVKEDAILRSRTYAVNPKSLLGVLSLDLTSVLSLETRDEEGRIEAFLRQSGLYFRGEDVHA